MTTSWEEFKNLISNNISNFVNSSNIINGSDFIAIIFPSDKYNLKEHLKKGISTVDLSKCTKIIKEYYSIPEDENFIILNLETKQKEIGNISYGNDSSFILGKYQQIEIFDYS